MSKMMIRNAGFERGNTDFWEAYADAVISGYNTDQKFGSWSGKAVYNATAIDGLLTADYSDVSEGEIVQLAGYIRPDAQRYGGIKVLKYDGDYSLIGSENVTWDELPAAWNYRSGFFAVPQDIEYIRVAYVNGGLSAGKSLLVDAASAIKLDSMYTQPLSVLIRANAAFATSFNTNAAKIDLLGCREYSLNMKYTYISGSATSIVLGVYEYDALTTGSYLIGSRTIGAVNTSESIRIDLTNAIGKQVYIDCVVTSPSSLSAYMAASLIGLR